MHDMRLLDKSLPYKNIIMVFESRGFQGLPQPALPDGYYLRCYEKGDEKQWAVIEHAVGEFESRFKARRYFKKQYMTEMDKLYERLVFACDKNGLPVANCSLWHSEQHERVPMIHWVATLPEHQNLGLGRAVVAKCLQISGQSSPGKDVFLHTQTWSYKAVKMYHELGFRMVKNTALPEWTNDYIHAMDILKDIYEPELYSALEDGALVKRL